MDSKKFIGVLGNSCMVLVYLILAVDYILKEFVGSSDYIDYIRLLLLGQGITFGEVGLACFIWLTVLKYAKKKSDREKAELQ